MQCKFSSRRIGSRGQFLNGFSRLHGKLAPTQLWHLAELAPTRELVPTLVLKNCPRGAKEYARVLNL
jgi:hypothetical protein